MHDITSAVPELPWSTRVRRHILCRSKAFHCACTMCSEPDGFAALPCPDCVPRNANGLLPPGIAGTDRTNEVLQVLNQDVTP